MTITTKLPFDHKVIGLMISTAGRTFIAWERQSESPHFGTHELHEGGDCAVGHYLHQREEAMRDMAERAGFATPVPEAKPEPRRRRRAPDYSHIDPADIDPDTGAPYEDYSSPCIEPHPFGGGISAGDY